MIPTKNIVYIEYIDLIGSFFDYEYWIGLQPFGRDVTL